MDLQPGQRIDEYELIQPAGAGGFSAVWQARRLGAHELHALKFPLVDEFVEHLRREASLSARIDDPQVVHVAEVRLDRQPPYLVLPWIEGKNLVLTDGPPEPAAMWRLYIGLVKLLDLTRVVARLHERWVVHGDLKPQNVIVGEDGLCRLLDLGLARLQLAARQQRSLAQSLVSVDGRSIAGTLEYMAPELLAGEPPTSASDCYSLGVMLHQQLTGRPPAFGVSPRALNPYLPPGVEELLRRALHHDPQRRFLTAGDLVPELERLVLEERLCLLQRNGHARRAVFLARMATLRRGAHALSTVALLAVLAGALLANMQFLLPRELLDFGTGLLVLVGLFLGGVALLLGVTTINARLAGVPEKTYKQRTGHPLWTFMMQ